MGGRFGIWLDTLMLVYPDTVLWNDLCDEGANPQELLRTLAQKGIQLVLSTQAVYEMAKTFQMSGTSGLDRGKKLFSFLLRLVEVQIPCLGMPSDILAEEMKRTSGETRTIQIFVGEESYGGMSAEVRKLSGGVFDQRADYFIRARRAHSTLARSEIEEHFASRPELRRQLEVVPVGDLDDWLRKEVERSGRRILEMHILWTFPELSKREARWLARRLLSSKAYRLSHAMVRADLYLNWRYAQVRSISRDVPDDLYHVVNAAHCEVYATKEKRQARYAPLVLTGTRVAIYDGVLPPGEWLATLAG